MFLFKFLKIKPITILVVFWRNDMNNMENFQEINAELKKLLDDIDNVKSTVDIFGLFIEKQLKLSAV